MTLSAELDDLALGVESEAKDTQARKPRLTAKKTNSPNRAPVGFYTLAQVCDHLGMARATVYNMIRSGEFPAPIKFGVKQAAWKISDCTDYIDKCVYASRGNSR